MKMKTLISASFAIAALALPAAGHAAAIAQLKAFVNGNKTLSADFKQVVSNKGKREEASGRLEIARPGKFRWEYSKPYEQLIVGDGKTLWVYDRTWPRSPARRRARRWAPARRRCWPAATPSNRTTS